MERIVGAGDFTFSEICVHLAVDHGFKQGMKGRAVQLDGMRAIAMMAICWDHWCPPSWPRVFPFEVFLFLFLVLTGYLITGSLLRERERRQEAGGPWRAEALKTYQIRRGLRILAPYYFALVVAVIVSPRDFGPVIGWYFFHVSNIHMAILGYWPAGTNHFWSLATQQQFYLIWPFVIWFLPGRFLVPVFLVFTAMAPASRMLHEYFETWVAWPQLLTWSFFDYFGIGALFALAVHRGMALDSPALRWLAGLALAGYIMIFGAHAMEWRTFGFRPFQQTLLSIGLCGIIAGGLVGFRGIGKVVLEHPALQRIGQLSYGIYLFHNLAPMVTGKIMPFLWIPPHDTGVWVFSKIVAYALVTWGLTLVSWRWVEQPLQGVRAKFATR